MNMFAIKDKHSAPATRRSRPSRFGYVGSRVKAQQAEIRRILGSTGAQAKLTVGSPNDKYEQEADRVADQVMGMRTPPAMRLADSPGGQARSADADSRRGATIARMEADGPTAPTP